VDRTTIVVAGTMAVPLILLMGWIRVLNNRDSWRLLLAASVVVAGGAVLLLWQGLMGRPEAIALAGPLYHVLLFRLGYLFFVHRLGREPVNVSHVWGGGLAPDRLFAFSFTMVAIFSVFAVVGPLIWGSQSP
jgi:hypothetical protein